MGNRDGHQGAGDRLDAPTLEASAHDRVPRSGSGPDGDVADGRTFLPNGTALDDTYRIVRLIGAGGMGDVYEVQHSRLAGRYAAKLLTPALAGNPRALSRFRREALIASALNHPHIVQVIDFRILSDGRPCLVMELLEGEDLAKVMAAGSLPPERALVLLRQIVSALSALHSSGVVHRDLKPQNIFVLPALDGEVERVKLVDFGLAKHPDPSLKLTQHGTLLGTPQYMAPEQASGAEVGPAADQFSLAAIAYEMVAGRPAFRATQLSALVYRIVHEQPPALGGVAPHLPVRFVEALGAAVSDAPPAPALAARAPRWSLLRGTLMWAVALAVTTALAGSFWSSREIAAARTITPTAHERPRDDTLVTTALSAPAVAPPEDAAPGRRSPAHPRQQPRPLANLEADPAATPAPLDEAERAARAQRLTRSGDEALAAGDAGEALRLFAAANDLAASAERLSKMARCEERLGRRVVAIGRLTEALRRDPGGALRDRIEEQTRALRGQLVGIEVTGVPRRTTVQIDGAAAGTTPLDHPLWVEPGHHRISVQAPGKPAWTTSIREEAGLTVSLPVGD